MPRETFSPPAFIPTAWLNFEPVRFVPLRQCTGLQLRIALDNAGPEEFRTLKTLTTLFIQYGGGPDDQLGKVLNLPETKPKRVLQPYVPNQDDPADRLYAARRSLLSD